jgi:hypothetical protein
MTVLRACTARGECVSTFMPSCTGQAQDGTRLRCALDFDHAEAAGAGRRHVLEVAEGRDVHAFAAQNFEQHLAGPNVDIAAIDGDGGHGIDTHLAMTASNSQDVMQEPQAMQRS